LPMAALAFCACAVWWMGAAGAAGQNREAAESERQRLHATEEWRSIQQHLADPATASGEALEQQADVLRARRFPEDALDYYRYAMVRAKDPGRLWSKMGLTQLSMGNMELARTCFKQAAKVEKNNSEAWNNLGAMEYLDHGTGAAVKDYKHAIKLDPHQAVYHANLSTVYFETKDFDAARREMETALKLDPRIFENEGGDGGVQAHVLSSEDHARLFYEMAKLYAREGQLDQMLRSLEKASEAGMDIAREMKGDRDLAKFENDPRVVVLAHNAQTLRGGQRDAGSSPSGGGGAGGLQGKPMAE
ncbi:MAG TPA: tetratricopeptide repeat protein, partial [Acidobacteriaceae bacterium]|nr:tetratricopeptide repeat protein [Acidobacteriaceae bacterium]